MLNKLRLCFNNSQHKIVSDNFTAEHGGCFALLSENNSNAAELFLFTDGTINLAEHIISLSKKLLENEITEVSSTVPAGNVKSLNILKRLTTNIVYDPNRMCYIGKGTAEDLQNAAEGKFLSVKNK